LLPICNHHVKPVRYVVWLRIGITKHGDKPSDCIKMLEIQQLWETGEELTSDKLQVSAIFG
jgi:hypothetical protein